jgi:hypothetical protein
MGELFLTNTITIKQNRQLKQRLDGDIHKSTIATNLVNHLKKKILKIKKNIMQTNDFISLT